MSTPHRGTYLLDWLFDDEFLPEYFRKLSKLVGYNVVEKIKLITFQGEKEKIKKNKITNYDKNKYMEKISKIKNDKIKNSLIELSKLYKKK